MEGPFQWQKKIRDCLYGVHMPLVLQLWNQLVLHFKCKIFFNQIVTQNFILVANLFIHFGDCCAANVCAETFILNDKCDIALCWELWLCLPIGLMETICFPLLICMRIVTYQDNISLWRLSWYLFLKWTYAALIILTLCNLFILNYPGIII